MGFEVDGWNRSGCTVDDMAVTEDGCTDGLMN